MEYVEGRLGILWSRFCELLITRFTPTGKDDILVAFNTLFYEDDMNLYHERFEELKAFVRSKYPALDDEFFMSKFLGELPMELRIEVQKFRPRSLKEMMNIAKLEEFRIKVLGAPQRLNKGNYVSYKGG